MKTFLKVAVALIVALATIGAQAIAAENVRYKGKVDDFVRVGLKDINRPGGPMDTLRTNRTTRINQYNNDTTNAKSIFADDKLKYFVVYEKIVMDSSKTDDERIAAKKEYLKSLDNAQKTWRDSEQKAYDKLFKDLKVDHKRARDMRTGDYREIRRRITYYLKISAKSKSKPGGGRFHSYTHIPEDDIAIPKVSNWREFVNVEWEIADGACANPDTYNCRGNNLDKRNVYFVPDPNMVGIRIDFQMDGGDYPGLFESSYWYTCECNPWCDFRPTQPWSEKQANKDMGYTDNVDKDVERLLNDAKFKRAKAPWE